MIFVREVQWNESQNNINTWFNFIHNVDTCIIKKYNTNHIFDRPTVERPSADWRQISASVCRRFFDKTSPTDRLAIVDRYHDVNFFKTSANYRPIIGWPSPDASPMTKPIKIGGSVNEIFILVLRKKSRRPTKNSAKIGADVGRFSKILLADRRPTVGLGNVTVV